ncbi:MAG: hypothetical protein KIG68_06605 [Oxalobacter sp.]|nr:hypothetical protein [Oxalobacter sp.]
MAFWQDIGIQRGLMATGSTRFMTMSIIFPAFPDPSPHTQARWDEPGTPWYQWMVDACRTDRHDVTNKLLTV